LEKTSQKNALDALLKTIPDGGRNCDAGRVCGSATANENSASRCWASCGGGFAPRKAVFNCHAAFV